MAYLMTRTMLSAQRYYFGSAGINLDFISGLFFFSLSSEIEGLEWCPGDFVKMTALHGAFNRRLPRAVGSFTPSTKLRPLIPRRNLGIPPQFLLDDYIPRYQLISSIDEAKKRSRAYAHLQECNLCPRKCGVNRYKETGLCLIGAEKTKVNVIAPHFGEEPCITGFSGSGSVFFSGCNLRCVFCQNHVSGSLSSLPLLSYWVTDVLTGCMIGYLTPAERIRSHT